MEAPNTSRSENAIPETSGSPAVLDNHEKAADFSPAAVPASSSANPTLKAPRLTRDRNTAKQKRSPAQMEIGG